MGVVDTDVVLLLPVVAVVVQAQEDETGVVVGGIRTFVSVAGKSELQAKPPSHTATLMARRMALLQDEYKPVSLGMVICR